MTYTNTQPHFKQQIHTTLKNDVIEREAKLKHPIVPGSSSIVMSSSNNTGSSGIELEGV